MDGLRDRLADVHRRISLAAERAGRDPGSVRLVAVTKTLGIERVREAVEAGLRDFGENYVQEAREKLAALGPDIRWHFIGHLQSNKARHVVGAFELIHSLDSETLAREIQKRSAAAGIVQDVLVEVRLDPAASKTGIEPEALPCLVEQVRGLPNVRLRGLMGMPPLFADPEDARPGFRLLRRLLEVVPPESRRELSMGMSSDFEVAIEEGATLVRVGTAIFGPRA
jgi:pyridoxal phosphate enzyme (YggS family)